SNVLSAMWRASVVLDQRQLPCVGLSWGARCQEAIAFLSTPAFHRSSWRSNASGRPAPRGRGSGPGNSAGGPSAGGRRVARIYRRCDPSGSRHDSARWLGVTRRMERRWIESVQRLQLQQLQQRQLNGANSTAPVYVTSSEPNKHRDILARRSHRIYRRTV